MLDRQLADFLEAGLAIYIASRNADLEPNGAHVVAVKVDDDLQHVVAFVPTVSAGAVLEDLRSNGQVAVVFTRPPDEKGCQVKGVFTDARDARPGERDLVLGQWERFRDRLEQVGLPRAPTDAWVTWPSVAIRFRVNALFDQTPGPGAGAPLP
ncbi:MAG: pyridoxamine 5'-phosphate oxidase family protein [Vicinamibacterales bacterium]